MTRGTKTLLLANATLLLLSAFANTAPGEGETLRHTLEPRQLRSLAGTSLQLNSPSPDRVYVGSPLEVSGSLFDSGVGLAGETVVVTFSSPNDVQQHGETLITDNTGTFSCDYVPPSAGGWAVEAHYQGSPSHSPATAPPEAFVADPADTFLQANLSAESIVVGTSLAVDGALRCGSFIDPGTNLLSGRTISLTLYDPSDTPVDSMTTTTTQTGFFRFQNVSLPISGKWSLRVQFAGNENLNPSSTDPLHVRARPSAGYAIIVSGRVASGAGLDSHNKTTDRAYKKFKLRGFPDENIFYFRYGTPSDPGILVDEAPRQEPDGTGGLGIRGAIITWAKDRMNSANGPLYILFVNHGNTEKFYVDPSAGEYQDRIIDPWELHAWMSQLENSLEEEAVGEPIVFIYGACYSGSFIPALSHEGKRRILIASADPNEPSFKGPMEADGVRDGEFFVTQLFASLGKGVNLKRSFEVATRVIEAYTSNASGNGGVSTTFYADHAAQHPLLDDNEDGVGSNDALSTHPGNDGVVSAGVILGYHFSPPATAGLTSVSPSQYLSPTDPDPVLEVRTDNADNVAEIWVAIKPPDFDLGEPLADISEQREVTAPRLDFDEQIDIGTYRLYDFNKGGFSGFTQPGRYQVLYFVKDKETGGISVLMESFVYRNLDPTDEPPGAFDLLEPPVWSRENTVLLLDWEDSSDPEKGMVSYTVEISTDAAFAKPEFTIEGVDGSALMIDESVGLKDLTDYYWRVIALDENGNRTLSSQTGSFSTNNTNGWGDYNVLTEIVRNRNDPCTWPPNSWIEIQPYVGRVYNHYYSALLPLGPYSVDSEAPDFSHEHDDVEVIEESPTTVLQLPQPDPGTVSGSVEDSGTLSSLRGATVRLEVLSGIYFGLEFTACSGDDGGFCVNDLPGALDYRMTVEKNYYASHQDTFSLAAGQNKDTGTIGIGFDDADSDGLPDAFEQLIVDADPEDEIEDIWDVSGDDDFDGDNVTNGEECEASTDPTSPESCLRTTCVSQEGNQDVTTTWASEPGVYYEIFCTDDFTAWSWLHGPIAASGTGSNSWTDDGSCTSPPPQESTKRFYRVQVY